MIKWGFMTDPHAKGVKPSTRTDDFSETIKQKLREFFRAGHAAGVDFFINGGDLFDSPYTTPSFVIEIGQLIEEELKGKPFFYVLGNHDLIGYSPKTVSTTAYGVMLTFLSNAIALEPTPTRYEFNGQAIYLSGVHSYSQLDRTIVVDDVELHRSRDYVIDDVLDAPSIHVVHGYLSPKPILDDIPHTVVAEMAHTKATFTLTGHEHTGFAPIETAHGLIYNPGATGRVFASRVEMNRMPRFAICACDPDVPGYAPTIQPEIYPCAVRGELVFDVEAIDARNKHRAVLQAVKGNLSTALQSTDIKQLSLKDMLDKMKDQTDPVIFDEARDRILNA